MKSAPTQHLQDEVFQESFGPPLGHGPRLPRDVLHDVMATIAHARQLLATGENPVQDVLVADFSSAQEMLADISRRIGDLALDSSPGQARNGLTGELLDLFIETTRVRERLRQAQLDLRVHTQAQVQEALDRLSGVQSVAQLIERIPENVCRLGFDRALFSQIQESAWIPQSCYVEGDPEWAAEVLRAGREQPQLLDHTVPETEAVRRRRPLPVTDAQRDPRVLTCLADIARVESYVVAPVLSDHGIVGIVHADRHMQRRHVDEFDREVLGIFAQGLGIAFRRTVLVERLHSLRTEVGQFTTNIANAMDEILSADGRMSPVVRNAVVLARESVEATRSCVESTLTPRQLEVLRLMADGMTNAGIALRLTISEGTAKSHVKQILRKLGAANRAEAVSLFLRMQQGRNVAVTEHA